MTDGTFGRSLAKASLIKLPRPLALALAKMACVYVLRTEKPGSLVPAWKVWVVTRRPGPGEAPGADLANDDPDTWAKAA
jgi:hypothetical protein